MFLLFPFVSPYGGWVEKYNGREIALCEGAAMPFETDNPFTHHVWYSGNFSQIEQNFSENEKPLWRVKTDRFKDDEQWEWFLNLELNTPNPLKLHECTYIEDGQDIYPSNIGGKRIGDEFQFPLWVLDLLIERGNITDKNMIKLIELRRRDEKEQGFVSHTLEELKSKRKEKLEKIKEESSTAFDDAMNLINPNKEIKKAKSPFVEKKKEEAVKERFKAKAPIKEKASA